MSKTIQYANEELEKYMLLVTNCKDYMIELIVDENYNFESREIDFDAILDDAYIIHVTKGDGVIIGVNERSVLMGVYKLFSLLGCVFFRPTADGEYIPKLKMSDIDIKYQGVASNRHRGICPDGSISLENLLDMIEWLPKVGLNSFFLQFKDLHLFFDRWYNHEGNIKIEREEKSQVEYEAYQKIVIYEIKKRGLIYHAVGHGWTGEAVSYPYDDYRTVDDKNTLDDTRKYLAMVNGKRTFFRGMPLTTQLCYSNKTVRKLIIEKVVDYISVHSEIDYLHFWLGDSANNYCECNECKKLMPSDYYVILLKELDEQLTKKKTKTKFVFLLYLELLWTPKQEKEINKNRYTMMYAPSTRTYAKSFLTNGAVPNPKKVKTVPYIHNAFNIDNSIETNIAFLYEWKNIFKGDSFDFDYHMWWGVYREYSNILLSKIIYEDVISLKKLGLNGLISCQVQRAFFPNGLCMYVMGETLFNTSLSYDELVSKYFKAAYGEFSDLALNYLEDISRLLSYEYVSFETKMIDKEIANNFDRASFVINEYYPELLKAMQDTINENQKKMLEYLVFSCKIYSQMANLYKIKASGASEVELNEQWQILKDYICSVELELQKVLDVFLFNIRIERLINKQW